MRLSCENNRERDRDEVPDDKRGKDPGHHPAVAGNRSHDSGRQEYHDEPEDFIGKLEQQDGCELQRREKAGD